MALNSAITTAGATALASQYNNLRKDVISQAGEYVTAGGTENALTFTIDAQITAYFDGLPIPFKASATNTGPATGDVNGLGAKNIKFPDGTDLTAGDITTGRVYMLRYDETNLIFLSASSNILGETTLGGAASTITVNFTAKKHLKFTVRLTGKANATNMLVTFNGDTGANYSLRRIRDGTAGGGGGVTSFNMEGTAQIVDSFFEWEVVNETSKSKYLKGVGVSGLSDASGTMTTYTVHGVWDNTAAQINSVTLTTSTGNPDFGTGSFVRVSGNN